MSKAKFILTTLSLVGLAGLFLYLNRDWFASQPIEITHRVMPWMRSARRLDPMDKANPVVFSFNKYYRFKDIKVVVAAELLTNRNAHPLWHLTSVTNSVSCTSFGYGDRVRGMAPKVKGATPDPLTPGVTYSLVVETEQGRATHDFSTTLRK
jgi:hypothetical protein